MTERQALPPAEPLGPLLEEIRHCRVCEAWLPRSPKPVIRGQASARLLIIGQAPGIKVHESGIPWNDASGERLRDWLQLSRDDFYDEARIAIMPMGLCYPGHGPHGDLPPRPECAPLWHARVRAGLPKLALTLLVGQYAQRYYLGAGVSLTERVRDWQAVAPGFWPLPHPSPRNQLWLKRQPWFAAEVLPPLQRRIAELMAS